MRVNGIGCGGLIVGFILVIIVLNICSCIVGKIWDGTQEVLARALFRLTCRRGSFPFLPELGSRLQELGREKPSAREAAAKIFCASALRDMELEVDDVRLTQLPDGHARMEVWLTVQDEKQALEVRI